MKHQRYVLFSFALGAILFGWLVQSAGVTMFAQFALTDNRIGGILTTTTLLGLVAGAGSFFGLIRSRKAVSFSSEVVGELLRVTWPSRDETVKASTTVVLTTLFTSAMLAVYDLIWKNLADLFLFTEG